MALELDDAVLHFAVVEHQHHEHALFRQADEFDLRNGRFLVHRQRHDACELRHRRQQLRHRSDQILRGLAAGVDLPANLRGRSFVR